MLVIESSSREQRRRLGPMAWAVLEEIALASEADDEGWVAVLGVRHLAAGVGITKDTAARAMAALASAGIVQRVRVLDQADRSRSGYRLNLPDGLRILSCPTDQDSAACPGHRDRQSCPQGQDNLVCPAKDDGVCPQIQDNRVCPRIQDDQVCPNDQDASSTGWRPDGSDSLIAESDGRLGSSGQSNAGRGANAESLCAPDAAPGARAYHVGVRRSSVIGTALPGTGAPGRPGRRRGPVDVSQGNLFAVADSSIEMDG
ncbi:MAG TPA: hypothetical protein VNF50_09850 [Acidimicrobiales bacterium]|nr:hypothetical protein [Acidimicrobiales bacterium]